MLPQLIEELRPRVMITGICEKGGFAQHSSPEPDLI